MIDIEIDNIKLKVPQNTMIIEAADMADIPIPIPRFCYHKKLTIAANCRMCLIEVEKVGKPLPACATPVSQGMRVFTRSAKALEAQRSVMEFLLINHPLDCPICDQGGECELQDVSMGFGNDSSRYTETKRSVADENLGPLISSDMTRCIQCTRCVRFGHEIAGVRELGATGRGEHLEIETYIKQVLTSELSANIIDLCPVGALTSKPYRFKARPWELEQIPSIAPHDAVGSNINIHVRRGKVMRVVPREEDEINEVWISDRDRFSYLGINSEYRLKAPMLKAHGEWYEVDWSTALNHVVSKLSQMIETQGTDQMGALGLPSLTLEECYLLQKFWRGIGGVHLDHRLHQTDFSDQSTAGLYPGLHSSLVELENKEVIVLIGSDIHHEQPLMAHRIRKASLQGAKVIAINPMDFELHFPVTANLVVHPQVLADQLAGIIKALKPDLNSLLPEFVKAFSGLTVNEIHKEMAQQLQNSRSISLLLGAVALNHPQASLIRWLTHYLAEIIESAVAVGEISEGSNAAGAHIAGLLPHRGAAGTILRQVGFDAQKMFAQPLKAYCLVGIEPSLDLTNSSRAIEALRQAEFVVAMSSFKTHDLLEVADVLLPMGTFAETSGTFVNAEGRWQSFTGCVSPQDEARPLWKILRVLGNLFNLEGFDYHSSEAVRDELLQATNDSPVWNQASTAFPSYKPLSREGSEPSSLKTLARISTWPIYRSDPLVRQSEALQQTLTQRKAGIYINPQTAETLGFLNENRRVDQGISENTLVWVNQGQKSIGLVLFIDSAIPTGCAYIPSGYTETAPLGENFGEISIACA